MDNFQDVFKNVFANTPEMIVPMTIMKKPNETIDVYNDEFILKSDNNEYHVHGKITLKWFPTIGLRFSGNVKIDKDLITSFLNGTVYKVIIKGVNVGDFLIQKIADSRLEESEINGIALKKFVLGDKSINVEKIHFEIVNLKEYLGEAVINSNRMYHGMNRISLENEKYIIHIDKRDDYKELQNQLKIEGGFITLYSCNLLKKKGSFSYTEVSSIDKRLYFFLSFLNGRRISPVFLKGMVGEEIMWQEYFSYNSAPYKHVHSWSPKYKTTSFSNLWKNFFQLCDNENDYNCLMMSIHWYLEANSMSTGVEGSILFIQNALELLYNWIIVEKKKLIKGEDAKNLNTSNKIRLLLSFIGLESDAPDTQTNLKKYLVDKGNDVPEIFIEIRNSIVHSHEEKRKKLKSIPKPVILEALHVGIWYVELILLRILNYQGDYYNRCSREQFEVEESVPWI